MIALPAQIRVYLYRRPTDMRKSFHGLVALTESALKQDPLSGSFFVFVNPNLKRVPTDHFRFEPVFAGSIACRGWMRNARVLEHADCWSLVRGDS